MFTRKAVRKKDYYVMMAAAYKKVLSGVSVESLKVSEECKEDLNNYMRLVSPGKSAYQVSQDSLGAISSSLSTELSKVRKIHRRRTLEAKMKGQKEKNLCAIKGGVGK